MYLIRMGFMLALLLAASAGTGYAQPAGFVSLFNGTDLSGWVEMGEPGAFTAEDGTLFLKHPHNYPNWLRSEKQYENFTLELEYQTVGWSETGIYLHAPLHGNPVKSGLKIHLRHDAKDDGVRATGALYDVQAPNTMANKPGDEWNRLVVHMDWPRLQVTLNGVTIHDLDMERSEALRWRLRKGYIGFEDIGTRVRYRNIRIRELPAREHGWRELLAGPDLAGWEAEGKARWNVRDGVLTAGPGEGTLRTQASYSAFEFQTYFRTTEHANGGIFFRFDPHEDAPNHYEVQIYNVPRATNPTGSIYGIAPARDAGCRDGEWCFLQLISDGAYTRVLLNGETVAETTRLTRPDRGSIAIQSHSDKTVEYKGIRVRPLRAQE